MAPDQRANRPDLLAVDRPGTRRATTALGAAPRDLMNQLPPDSPHLVITKLVHRAAVHLDDLDENFRKEATWLAQRLNRAAANTHRLINSTGLVQMAGPSIDLLAARIYDADKHLGALLDAYDDLGPRPSSLHGPTQAHTIDAEHAPTRTAATSRSRTPTPRPGPEAAALSTSPRQAPGRSRR
jgi:hypothetical protein